MSETLRPFRNPPAGDLTLAHLRNLGPKSATMLAGIGITDREQLARAGALEACRQLRESGHSVSLNMAYAIEGALMDVDWRDLPADFRRNLQREWQRLDKKARRIDGRSKPSGYRPRGTGAGNGIGRLMGGRGGRGGTITVGGR